MVRFFSLVPFTTACKSGARPGYNYRAFSSKVYQSIGVSEGVTKVPGGINDSWDFCSSNHFQTLFQGINHTIRQDR